MKRLAPALVVLLAFALRVVGLTTVPPGWRDDEVIETAVHAQLVLDGHYPLYFIQAEGHEPLYHYLTAGWIALVGRSLFAVRLVSVIFGTLTVAAAYRLTRQLFGARMALLVALLLVISFWALMYSRTKIRHIAELPFILLAFSHLFKIIGCRFSATNRKLFIVHPHRYAVGRYCSLFILFSTLALYTYLAATALFFIIAAFLVYLLFTTYLFRSPSSKHAIAAIFISLVIIGLLYLPLANAIRANAARLGVVGGPLTALRQGDWQPLIENTVDTLAMFGNTGDNEALYNLPGRPVFNLVGFYFFAGGLFIAFGHWRDPRYAFLLIWLVGSLLPAFASSPPASLGHTITALPVTYILTALPITVSSRVVDLRMNRGNLSVSVSRLLSGLLLISVAADLPDYFVRWPANATVRYLYKADLHATAQELRSAPPATYVLNGPLSRWDRVAFTLEDLQFESTPRWVNADWAFVFPPEPATYLFDRADWQTGSPPEYAITIPFSNELIFDGFSQRGRELFTHWHVGAAYTATEPDMGASVASPPFPAFIFVHLLDSTGTLAAGSDRFDVDAFSLQPGDRFIQRHTFAADAPAGEYAVEIGLYDPSSGARYTTADGHDAALVGEVELP